ncbi:MAG: putative sulfate exporter family transporter [Rikenellaceae bacterium]
MINRSLFLFLIVASLFLSPAFSLFMGIAYALVFEVPYKEHTSKLSSLLLKVAVVGIGFGMNIEESLRSSSQGILFTIFSVVIVMVAGVLIGRAMKVGRHEGYLIASGTAICGGSAIAAVAPVIGAKRDEMSISLAVVFTLNAIAMLIFPYIGRALDLSQSQFGMWAAIAIHDTSAVVGAAKAYGEEALQIATTVKLSRALWIIPLSLITALVFRRQGGASKISIPWFIFLFIIAMTINTYLPLGEVVSNIIKVGSHKILNLTLFLIGSSLSLASMREMGVKPVVLGVILWVLISVLSLSVIML